MRIKSHVGCCYLLAATKEVHIVDNIQKKSITTKITKKAVFKSAYLTSSERVEEQHFRELIEIKKSHKHSLFKD